MLGILLFDMWYFLSMKVGAKIVEGIGVNFETNIFLWYIILYLLNKGTFLNKNIILLNPLNLPDLSASIIKNN